MTVDLFIRDASGRILARRADNEPPTGPTKACSCCGGAR